MKTFEEIEENYNMLYTLFDKYILNKERKEKLTSIYKEWETVLVQAPFASNKSQQYAYTGGYIVATIQIIRNALTLYDTYIKLGYTQYDFTKEELFIATLNSNLGRLLLVSEHENELYNYYEESTDNWRKDKLGELYTINPSIPYMEAPHRALYNLQFSGFTLTRNEHLAILLYQGNFNQQNNKYMNNKLSNIVHIVQEANRLANAANESER